MQRRIDLDQILSRIIHTLIVGHFSLVGLCELCKAYTAKMPCNQVVIDLAMYLLKNNSALLNNTTVSLMLWCTLLWA